MIKKLFAILVFGFVLFSSVATFAQAQESIKINFFYSKTCPHCAEEEKFLDDLEQRYPELEIKRFEISEGGSIRRLKDFYQKYNVPKKEWGLVPATFTQERYFLGFNKTVAQELEACIERCLLNGGDGQQEIENKISLPLIGDIDPSKYSLPVLAVILGFFDGFNVCSLGALVLILGLVLIMRSRKRMLMFGGIFILTTAVLYGLLLVLWYHIFAFFSPYLRVMEILIGLLGVGGGVYFLREFIRHKRRGPVCNGKRSNGIVSKFSSKMERLLQEGGGILAIAGAVFLFAAVITVVEFPCSAAIPVFFAGVLAQAELPALYYLVYIVIFLLFYLLDEIIVFLIAVFTMSIKLASAKFTTWITLIESVVLFLLGLYYLFGFLIF